MEVRFQLDKKEIIDALDKLKKLGCDQIAISSVFATVRGTWRKRL